MRDPARERIAFARDGLDERGFAAAVGTQDGDVLADADAQADVAQHHLFGAHHPDALHVDERTLVRWHG